MAHVEGQLIKLVVLHHPTRLPSLELSDNDDLPPQRLEDRVRYSVDAIPAERFPGFMLAQIRTEDFVATWAQTKRCMNVLGAPSDYGDKDQYD